MADGLEVIRVKITLDGFRPAIWRRVETKDCSLAELHAIIQLAMGWEFSHLWSFEIGKLHFGEGVDRELNQLDANRIRLAGLLEKGARKFKYLYDFGDCWQHSILLERAVKSEPKAHYPRCIKGERACPPEDCGGVWGYSELLDAIADPADERHEERLEWIGGEFDSEKFDLDEANKRLGELRKIKR